ncbi:MAG: hypothetical protein JW990_06870, partial [Thermoleophilia bacterium]|nr:hypothetical protein [Thermoleophilia bacterium]
MATLQEATRAATRSLSVEEAGILIAEYTNPKDAYERAVRAAALAARAGKPVLSLRAALQAGGPVKGGWVPALALAPAGSSQVRLSAGASSRRPRFALAALGPAGNQLAWSYAFDMADASAPPNGGSAEATVPPVPPRVQA